MKDVSDAMQAFIDAYSEVEGEGYTTYYGAFNDAVQRFNYEMENPPEGILPIKFWIEQRIESIEDAIRRYQVAGIKYPPHWYHQFRILKTWHAFITKDEPNKISLPSEFDQVCL